MNTLHAFKRDLTVHYYSEYRRAGYNPHGRKVRPMNEPYLWSRLYVNAILETDSRKRSHLIRDTEAAIRQRLKSSLPIDLPEKQLIMGASTRLRALKSP
jgi:lysozyme family protein